ncbi:MAG: CRISPR-associated endoribonuclease Cas6 [Clostridiales bacterium]|jgi:CRISPR-associated endoribonuclease Cas6|nr:CRISPR-associated endoribonuclease Cas6 [Eubacteriales bacterium]MDH7567318.1 CRISPR-associated endoribonuclease Cas6 [Clostridiales bacterium]
MHIIITFESAKPVILPINYNHLLQALIYKTMDHELANFLHTKGYGEGRKFKLFCFSNLRGNYDTKRMPGFIVFQNRLELEISSPLSQFCESLANGFLKKTLRLGENILLVQGVSVDWKKITENRIMVDTLSPVVAYSTLLRPDGRSYTCYFQPGENDFERISAENLRKKYRALYREDGGDGEISIKCLNRPRLHVIQYKDTIIKGYSGRMLIEGPPELLQVALDAGLGSKNSQGFGCLRIK